METLYVILSFFLSIGACGGVIFLMRRQGAALSSTDWKELTDHITEYDGIIANIPQDSEGLASKSQVTTIGTQTQNFLTGLESQRALLKELESRLESANTQVIERERAQQELKSFKEEEEVKLLEVTANYQAIADKSIALEQELAESLKNLDVISKDVPMTDDQRAIFIALSEALSDTGTVLRDLIMDNQTSQERLSTLMAQRDELENEYTKLVEQQLGA